MIVSLAIQKQYEESSKQDKQQHETDKQTIAAHLKTIEENEAEITTAKQNDIEYKRVIAVNKLIIDGHQHTIAEDKKNLAELNTKTLDEKGAFNAIIEDLKKQIGEGANTIATHEGTIATHLKTIQDVQLKLSEDTQTIADRNAQIVTHEGTIAVHVAKIEEDKKTIEARDASIETNNKTIVECNKTIAQHEAAIKKHESKEMADKTLLEDRATALGLRDGQITQLKKQVEYYNTQYTDKIAELGKSNAQLASSGTSAQTNLLLQQVVGLTVEKPVLSKRILDLEQERDKLTAEKHKIEQQLATNSALVFESFITPILIYMSCL